MIRKYDPMIPHEYERAYTLFQVEIELGEI